jgi:hypothetical protein
MINIKALGGYPLELCDFDLKEKTISVLNDENRQVTYTLFKKYGDWFFYPYSDSFPYYQFIPKTKKVIKIEFK